MAAKDQLIFCEYCKKGRVTRHMQEMTFRQWSDRGAVHCRVMLSVGICDYCDARSFEPGTDKIFEDAFQREYDKLKPRD